LASQKDETILGKYSAILANQLVQSGKIQDAVSLFTKWGAAPILQNFALYKSLIKQVLALPSHIDSQEIIVHLKQILQSLILRLHDNNTDSTHLQEFEHLAFI